jgi:tetratricopeptide (TPR) repeat protein
MWPFLIRALSGTKAHPGVDSASNMCFCGHRENGVKETSMIPNAFLNTHSNHIETTAKHGKFHKAFAGFLLCFMISSISPALSYATESLPDLPPGTVASKDPIFYDSALPGINLVLHDRFKESLLLFGQIQETYPAHPAPHFFKAATYQSWMSFSRLNRFQEEFEKNIQLTIEKGNKLLKEENNPWILFYVGAAYGYRAFNNFRKHNWINAYFDAKKGVGNFQEALKEDTKLFDVYLGLGTYHYWRTAKSNFLRLITFWIPDKRELGLRQIEFAFQHGSYAPDQAGYNLVAAYFDYGQYKKAMQILKRILEKKKNAGLSDLYYKGRLLIEFERLPEAESVFREILEHLENDEFASTGYKAECMYWIAALLARQKKRSEALEFAEMALAQSGERNADSELEGPFENFREIKNRLENLHRLLKGEEVDFFEDEDLLSGWRTEYKAG